MLTSPANYLFIALKAELGKAVLLFQIFLIITVDIIPPTNGFYTINNGKSIIS